MTIREPAFRQLSPEAYPSLADAGFEGGRNGLRAFCRRMFAGPEPRFLRSDRGWLVVFRHADLRALAAIPDIGNVPPAVLYPQHFAPGAPPTWQPGRSVAEVVINQVFTTNGALHAEARRILVNWLAPKPVAAMEPLARSVAREVLGDLGDDSAVDFVSAVAERYTTRFWSRALHLSPAEEAAMAHHARAMTLLFRLGRSSEETRVLDEAFAGYRQVVETAARRNLDAGDPLALDLDARVASIDCADDYIAGGVAPKSLGAFLAGNLIEAFHTAALAAANAAHVLVRHPDILARARSSPDELAAAVSEALRLEPPVIMLGRYVLKDVLVGDVRLAAGTGIEMMWGAGNLDPGAFPEPERFDPSRRLQGTTIFGGGGHICPGRHAALMLTRILLETMDRDGVVFAPAGEPQWYERHGLCQLASLPVKVGRRCAASH